MHVLRILVIAIVAGSVCSAAAAQAFMDDFESYAAGSGLHGQNGWKGWNNSAGAGAPVSDAFAYSGSNSVEVVPTADLVHEFDIAGGTWVFTAMQYIPSGGAGTTWFILLNTYSDSGTQDWSVQLQFNLDTDAITSQYDSAAAADIVYDEWVELKLVIDLDENTVDEYYNGELFSTHQWDDGEHGTLEVIDLYGNNASSIYYDDILVETLAESRLRAYHATKPRPGDQVVDVPRDVTLTWTPGTGAASHDVYFGMSLDDVDTADRGNPMGVLVSEGQGETAYDPDGLLEFSQSYYWRIDEVNAAPDNTIFKGTVWSFTAEPFVYPVDDVVATSNGTSEEGVGPERTIDGSGLNADDQHSTFENDMWLAVPGAEALQVQYDFDGVYKLHEMLVWNFNVQFELMLGFGLKDVTAEYSADGETWEVLGDVTLAQATATEDYVANNVIPFNGVPAKHVRLTVHSGYGLLGRFGLSEVRFMYVPAHAREPQPADALTGVSVGTVLSWRAGREAVTHDVYLGTDPEALALAGSVDEASYAPTDLEFGLDYFWKVDEVNGADAITTWGSAVWGFQTEEYAAIDDMESYNDDENRIYDSWLDGFTNGTGSTVGYFNAPFVEKTIRNSGAQSMPLEYANDAAPFYSEAQLDLGSMNLDSHGADSLRLYIAGQSPSFLETAEGGILMNAIGTDIWGNADEFRYVYKQLTGNGSMVALVEDLDETPNSWAKAGVMIRQTTAVGSTHSFMCMTGGSGNGASWQGRPTENATSVNNDATDPVAPPYWVRIDRAGDTLTGFVSPDGQAWTQIGDARSIAMTDPVLIGLALTSHNANRATSAEFSNVGFTGNVTGNWTVEEIGVAQPEGNIPEAVYVALEDTGGSVVVVTHPDGGLSGKSGWTEWTIPYSDLGGLNLNRVAVIYVGVGNRDNPSAGGTGLIFVDDIGYGRAYTAPAAP